MTTIQASPQETYRKLFRLSFGANFLGGLITFLYLSVIDPVPAGEASVRSLESADIASFVIAVAVIFAGAFVLNSWLQRPIRNWQSLIEAGTPASDLPQSVASRVLNWPLISSAIIACTWLITALFFSFFYNNLSNFVGIAIGGAVTTAVVYSGRDLLWRQIVPIFFSTRKLERCARLSTMGAQTPIAELHFHWGDYADSARHPNARTQPCFT